MRQQRCWRLENTGEPGRNPHRHMENIYYTIIGLYDMGLCNNYGVVHKLWSCVTVTRLCNHLRWNTVVLTQMMTLHVMYVCKFVIEYIVCNCVCCRSKRWAQEKFFQSVYLLLYYVQKLHSATWTTPLPHHDVSPEEIRPGNIHNTAHSVTVFYLGSTLTIQSWWLKAQSKISKSKHFLILGVVYFLTILAVLKKY